MGRVVLDVPSETSTKLIDNICRAVKRRVPDAQVVCRRRAMDSYHLSTTDPSIEEDVVNAVEGVARKGGFNWVRADEEPKGAEFPRPLSETAAAYRLDGQDDAAGLGSGVTPTCFHGDHNGGP